jgi:hypothetical protein
VDDPGPGAAGTVRCPGCAGLVPDVAGPTHAYMRSAPGCWALFGELGLRATGEGVGLAVDAFAAQHPGGAEQDRRQRQSVGVHLVALCLVLDLGLTWPPLERVRGRTSALALPPGRDWPHLGPPRFEGRLAVADLLPPGGGGAGPVDGAAVRAWAEDVWDAWSAHHATVRAWATAVRDGVR